MDILFLDANVLFSASYLADSGLQRLWHLKDVRLITSSYAVEEAQRNLEEKQARERLAFLLELTQVVSEPPPGREGLGSEVNLPEKDVPILRAAVLSGASHLITGDLTHFGPYLGRKLAGVKILTPGAYLRGRGGA